MTKIVNFMNDESGAAAAEYALILALIAVVIITALGALGSNIASTMTYIAGKITAS